MGAGGWGLALLVLLLLLGALPTVVRGGGWFEAQQLLASDGAADDEFGYSVAVSGESGTACRCGRTFVGLIRTFVCEGGQMGDECSRRM
jgi:hypothetical protein